MTTDPRKFIFDTVTLTERNSNPTVKALQNLRSSVNEDDEGRQKDLSVVNYCSDSEAEEYDSAPVDRDQ